MVQENIRRPMRKSSRQTREFVQRLGKLSEAQAALGWAIILMLVALIGAIYLNQTSEIATTGRQVQELEFDLADLRKANAELERQIAKAQTLEILQQAADSLGFESTESYEIEYLVIPEYPSETAVSVPAATPEPLPQPAESIQEAIFLSLDAAFADLIRGESNEQ